MLEKIKELKSQLECINKTNEVSNFINLLDEKIRNKEFYEYICENFIEPIKSNEGIKVILLTSNQIKVKNKDNDSFEITFMPSIDDIQKITTKLTCWQNKKVEIKSIEFDENKINLESKTSIVCAYFETGEVAGIELEQVKSTYYDNLLFHKHSFKSANSIDIKRDINFSLEQDKYVSSNQQTYERTCKVCEENPFDCSKLEYSKNDISMNEIIYNSRDCNLDSVISNSGIPINEEEYNAFIKEITNQRVITK